MKSLALLCACLLAAVPVGARAVGINLSYDDCGTFGTGDRTFACDTNAGTNVLVGSFVAPAGLDWFYQCEAELEIQTDSATLPDWWQFKNSGTCRSASLSLDFTPVPSSCEDFFDGGVGGGIGVYDPGYLGANRARIWLVYGVKHPWSGSLTAGVEYYAFKLTFNNLKSTGTGSCSGCSIPACINTRYIKLVQEFGVPGGDVTVSNPADRAYVRWQSASDPVCIGATPARSSTWGSIKSLYR